MSMAYFRAKPTFGEETNDRCQMILGLDLFTKITEVGLSTEVATAALVLSRKVRSISAVRLVGWRINRRLVSSYHVD